MSIARVISPRVLTPAASFELLESRSLLSGGETVMLDWGGGEVSVRPDRWLVEFESPVTDAAGEAASRDLATRLGGTVQSFRSLARGRYGAIEMVSAAGFAATLASVRAVLSGLPGVRTFEPDRVHTVSRVPNDPQFGQQWTHENTGQFIAGSGFGVAGADISSTEAWDTGIGTRDVVIAVIDTGVDINHEDLAANIFTNLLETPGNGLDDDANGFIDDVHGWDFGELDNDPSDVDGHGTACAGLIGAVGDNGIGAAGVAWAVSILPLKIADRFGGLSTSAIVASHDYATMMRGRGVNVVASNNSYGAFLPTFYEDAPDGGFVAERDAIARFINSTGPDGTGATFVASAGNSAFDIDTAGISSFPASYNVPGIVSVAATTNQDTLAGFSNWGVQRVDVAAPGVSTFTTQPGNTYTPFFNGTSAAGPIVAGMVAVLKSIRPNASPEQLREVLINSSDPLPSLQSRVRSGGRVNLAEAIRIIGIAGPVVTSISPGPVSGQLDPATNLPINTIRVSFNKPINSSLLSPTLIALRGAGADDLRGTGDDVTIPILSAALDAADPTTLVIGLNLSGFPGARLPIDPYRLTILAQSGSFMVRDTDGNFLNGNQSAGATEVYDFAITNAGGENEPNDSTAQATPVNFGVSGEARFTSVTLGNGLNAGLDVDLYRLTLPRGGRVTAEVIAQRLPAASTLDSYLRLFGFVTDEFGQTVLAEIASNDQFFGQDSYLDFFVNTGGTYFIGVSGFGNAAYDPAAPGSGQSQSTGVYSLTLRTQLVDDGRLNAVNTTPARLPPAGTQGTLTSFITIADARQIIDVNLRFDITHDYAGDLRISLISPGGTEVLLVNRRGGSGDDFTATQLDDEATTPIASGVAPFTGVFRPDTALSLFDGQSAQGLWTLRIVDAQALNDGFLNSWSLDFTLRNDIFGPFELNDTAPTARDLTEIATGGSATRAAFLGDGGFGALDRDFFRFTASAGSGITAVVTAQDAFDSALALLDSTGRVVKFSNLSTTRDARIDDFVITDGGTYYLAVVEASIGDFSTFNAFTATGQTPAATAGRYTLRAGLTPGVSDGAFVLTGDRVQAGINTGATLLVPNPEESPSSPGTGIGLRLAGVEFLYDLDQITPNPQAFFGLSFNGAGFRNSAGTEGSQVPFALTAQSDAANQRVTAKALYNGLRVERAISFGLSDSFLVFDIALTNTTTAGMSDLAWMEGLNPQMGLNLDPAGGNTLNDVDNTNPFVSARFVSTVFQQGLSIALAAAASETRAVASAPAGTLTFRDAAVLLAAGVADPNGVSGDNQLTLAFDLGVLAPGATTTLRYFMFLGTTPTEVDDLYNRLNTGTGAGHLAAESDDPADIALSAGQLIPDLPFKQYYPEGFANEFIYTYVPIFNPNDQPTRVIVLARNEDLSPGDGDDADRDIVLGDFVIPANSRGGLTLNTPELYTADLQLVDKLNPYAIEVLSERPVAATFSYYDTLLLGGARSAVGESFTTRVAEDWSFGQGVKGVEGEGIFDFVLFQNTTDRLIKVDTTVFAEAGGAPVVLTMFLQPFRRGGWAMSAQPSVPTGRFSILVEAEGDIVAALTHFERDAVSGASSAEGRIGNPDAGTTGGVLPDGRVGLNATAETLGVLNPGVSGATVVFSFTFTNGSAYRTSLSVPARSSRTLDVMALPGFDEIDPQAYSVSYTSNEPVSVSGDIRAFSDGLGTATSDRAFTNWGFGEGFRPADGSGHAGLVEYLRLYNPGEADTTVEITIGFDGGLGAETFRRLVPQRRALELNLDQFITGSRRSVNAWYGVTVKSATPVVAYMAHYDAFFPGAFGTLGTPLGVSEAIGT